MKKIIKNYKKIPIFIKLLFITNKNFLKKNINLLKIGKKENVNFKDLPNIVHKKATPIFILSTGRCGTKLISILFNKFNNIEVQHTPKNELIYYSKIAFEKNNLLFNELKYAIDMARYEDIRNTYLYNKIYIETNNKITFFAPQLENLYKKAKFIHIIRHPGSFIRSGIRRKWYIENNLYEEGRLIPPKNIKEPIKKIAWLWYETNNFIEKFKSLNKGKVLTIKFEDLIKNGDSFNKILRFININNNIDISNILKKPINKQKKGNFPRYKDWTQKQKNILNPYKDLMNKYGYK